MQGGKKDFKDIQAGPFTLRSFFSKLIDNQHDSESLQLTEKQKFYMPHILFNLNLGRTVLDTINK
jgi:hypothetical protein